MADDLELGKCPRCKRTIMLKTTTGGFVYGKCQGFHTDDGSHCGFSFQYGRKESRKFIADAAKADRKPEPEETEIEQETEPRGDDPAGSADGGRGIFD